MPMWRYELTAIAQPDGKIIVDGFMIELLPEGEGERKQTMSRAFDTKDPQIKAALVSLGWTPPGGEIKCVG